MSEENKNIKTEKDINFSENEILIKKFIDLFSSLDNSKDKVAIFTHNTPDPDAMGSARGLQWLLYKKFGLTSDIFYCGEISHPQNRTMVNILDLRMKPYENVDIESYAIKVCVDTTEKNCPIENIDVVIDHHRSSSNANLNIIEPVGAASTLVFELIQKLKLSFEEETDEDVSTALFIGIRVDTSELISETTTDRDFFAFKFLSDFVNRKNLASIIDYPIPNYFFELERELNKTDTEGQCINQKVGNSCFVGCIGIVSQAKRDAIPMLADKVVRMEGIETSVVFGIVGDKIIASIRSRNSSVDVNSFAQSIFGKDFAGGKLGSAGASVPLGIFSVSGLPNEIKNMVWDSMKETIFYKVLHIATGN